MLGYVFEMGFTLLVDRNQQETGNQLLQLENEVESSTQKYLYITEHFVFKVTRGMVWGGRWEGGSEWGAHVHLWWIHIGKTNAI